MYYKFVFLCLNFLSDCVVISKDMAEYGKDGDTNLPKLICPEPKLIHSFNSWVDGLVLYIGFVVCKAPGSISAWAIYPWGECIRNSAKKTGFEE